MNEAQEHQDKSGIITDEYQEKLDEAAEEVFLYASELWVIKDLLKDKYNQRFNKAVIVSSTQMNFRDAIVHYEKMYDAAVKKDKEKFLRQYTCVIEHLNRGLKDFAVYLCFNYYVQILHGMLDHNSQAVKKFTPELRHIYHNFKNLVVDVRTGGHSMQHLENRNTYWLKDVLTPIKDLYKLLDENASLNRIYSSYAFRISEKIIKKTI